MALRIAFGSDHAGYEGSPAYKPEITAYLQSKGISVLNCGTDSPDAVDYPDVAKRVTDAVLGGDADQGILLCGTGIGMSIAANRRRGIRAAVCVNTTMAKLAREHNHANVLCLGRRLVTLHECREIIDAWLAEPQSTVERHQRRVDKMDSLA